jgi:hypothetical protein
MRGSDPRLALVVGLGIAALGLIFSNCEQDGYFYTRDRLFCIRGIGDLQLFGIPYTWQLGLSVCLLLYAVYRFLQENK